MKDQELPEERRSEILNILFTEGTLKVPDLSKRLRVSVDTIRRDLIELEQEGHLSRVHGGALPKSRSTRSYATRKKEQHPAIDTLAKRTAELLKNGQVVFLDSGTTAVAIARNLSPTLMATVVTTSPPVAVALAEHPEIEVITLPGILNRDTMSVTGATTLEAVKQIRADICIVGVCAIHHEVGITTTHYGESVIKRQMVLNADETVVAVTGDKLGTAVAFGVAEIARVDRMVTEASLQDDTLSPYEQVGIEIVRTR